MKKLFAIILCAMLIFSGAVAMTGNGAEAADVPDKTNASYVITNVWELQNMSLDLTGDYTLANDIDASITQTWNAGAGFAPVGNNTYRFNGSFDGNNYTITGLYINRPSTYYVGLFGYTGLGAMVKYVGLSGNNITGDYNVGGLVGRMDSGTMTNCFVKGSITGTHVYVGGLIGRCVSSTVSNSYSSGTVKGIYYLGGLVGELHTGSITHAYSRSNVNGEWYIGGLVGNIFNSLVSNSYALGSAYGWGYLGGFIGLNSGTSIVTNCYSTGLVTGLVSEFGGLMGYSFGTVTDCFWDVPSSNQVTSAAGTGKTDAEMKAQATFTGWNFTTVWAIKEGVTYPLLRWQLFAGGDGTAANPFIITNVWELQNMSMNVAANYTLGNDIDASATVNWNGGSGFIAIGPTTDRFTGNFDGQNFTITDFNQHGTVAMKGLFAYVRGNATIRNVRMVDANITGQNYGGVLASWVDSVPGNRVTVSNCHASGTMTGIHDGGGLFGWVVEADILHCSADVTVDMDGDRVGGLAGTVLGGPAGTLFDGCSASGNIRGTWMVGGLVGGTDNHNSFKNSHATGVVIGEYVGGFIGECTSTISNCYATGNVSGGTGSTGGFAGYCTGITTNCYATGSVSGIEFVGGFAGIGGKISSCYATGKVSGQNTVGGFVGINEGGIEDSYATGPVNGSSIVGGFVGINYQTISCSYSIGTASGSDQVGGFAGNNSGGTITDCFWDVETSGTVTGIGGGTLTGASGKSTSEMMAFSTFLVGWNFASVWAIKDTFTYPFFRWDYRNDAPTSSDDHYSASERTILNVAAPGVLANDDDPDLHAWAADLRDVLEVADETTTSAFGADITIFADGSFTYDPTGSAAILALGPGETLVDSFTYGVVDSKDETDTATVFITVTGLNYAPVTAGDSAAIGEDALLSVPAAGLLANDIDSDGDIVSAVPSAFTNAKGATIVINADGSYSYDPRPSAAMQALAVGEWLLDSFTYTVLDPYGAMAAGTVTVNVTGANDAPSITTPNIVEVIEGAAYSVDYGAIDVDASDALFWSRTTSASWLGIDPVTGVLSGTPQPGIFTVNVSVSDGHGGSDWTTFTLTVHADTDGDGTPNYLDDDDDGDGWGDYVENLGGTDPLDPASEPADADGDGIADFMDPDFLVTTVWNNATVWNNLTIPEYHNNTVWNNQTVPEYLNTTVWNNQTIPEYHNTTVPEYLNTTVWNNGTAAVQAETPLWAWAAVIAAVAMGAVALVLAVRRPGGKRPEDAPEPEPTAEPQPGEPKEG